MPVPANPTHLTRWVVSLEAALLATSISCFTWGWWLRVDRETTGPTDRERAAG